MNTNTLLIQKLVDYAFGTMTFGLAFLGLWGLFDKNKKLATIIFFVYLLILFLI